MDWQILAVWLVAGGVVIAILARWFLRYLSGGKGDGKGGENSHGGGKPPCCG